MSVGRREVHHALERAMPKCWSSGFKMVHGQWIPLNDLKKLERFRARQIRRVMGWLKNYPKERLQAPRLKKCASHVTTVIHSVMWPSLSPPRNRTGSDRPQSGRDSLLCGSGKGCSGASTAAGAPSAPYSVSLRRVRQPSLCPRHKRRVRNPGAVF